MSSFYALLNSFSNTITGRYDIKSQVASAGLWKIYSGTRKTTGQQVAIFIFEKKILDNHAKRDKGTSRNESERVYEFSKKEAAHLARLRHPSLLEVVEPVHESRTAIAFATEPIIASLSNLLGNTDGFDGPIPSEISGFELDELETQKGLLQVGKGLQFLHNDAKVVHSNLTPDAILVNAKGDWKIGGFGFSMFLNNIAGEKTSDNYYEYNDFIPANAQKNLDYLAPEFVIDNEIAITNDMFALGCLIYSVHNRGATLLNTFHNIRTYERKVQALATLDFNNLPFHLQDVIRRLLTRDPSRRMTATEFQVSKVFDNILVSTMKYMESFPEKTREEKAAFMKGMVRVLGQFPDRVLIRKILPSLLEELKDHSLLPFTLPNIFYIIQKLTAQEFSDRVLSSLKPIFTIREPPQNLLVLLEKLDLLQQKTPREVFRDDVMPLIYAALETPVPAIQEKALKVIPTLTESLDYTTIKGSLFPRVQALFVQTTILSVKVSTLICFHSLLKVLDKFTMQEKLVPILKNIKTKEPAVMLATLAVYDEMGKHLDKEIIATELLPQLWRMSFGPLLNVDQFKKFMKTIRELSARVEEQHTKHLQQVRSLEEQTRSLTTDAVMAPNNEVSSDGAISDFERLVQGNLAQSHSAPGGDDAFGAMVGSSTVVSGNTNIGMFGEDSLSNSGSASPQFAKQLQQQQQSRPSSPMSGTGFGHSPVFGTTKSASVYQQPATPTLLTSKYQHPTSVSPTLSSIPHMASNNLSSPSRSSSPLSSTWAKSTTLVAAPIIPLQPPIVSSSSSSSSSMITPVQPPIDNGFGSMTSAPMNTSIHQRSQVVSSIPVVAPNFDALKSYPGSFSHTPTTIFPNNNFGNEMMAGGMGVLQPTSGISSGSMGVMQPTAYNGDGRVNSSSNKAKKEDLDLFDPFAK